MERIHIKSDELTANFLKKIVIYEFSNPSGLGGPGCVQMLSDDKKSYIMNVVPESCGYKFEELYKVIPILQDYKTKSPCYYWKERQNGWKYYYNTYGSHLLIKNEVYDQFMEKYLKAIQAYGILITLDWDEIAIKALWNNKSNNNV